LKGRYKKSIEQRPELVLKNPKALDYDITGRFVALEDMREWQGVDFKEESPPKIIC